MSLHVLMSGQPIGELQSNRHGQPELVYRTDWREATGASPLSLSLPLARSTHPTDVVSAVLWGLLPDNENTLQRWGSRFHVSPRNPVALLAHVGEDCAGAVQFVTEERLQTVLSGESDGIELLTDHEAAQRLARVRQDVGAGRTIDDAGQFSLAGAQAKIALLKTAAGWAIPSGRIPTTHILKPPSGDYEGFVENEMFCLRLARTMDLPAAWSEKLVLGEETAICVERYDRVLVDGTWQRIHQEDFCQALGVMPHIKYQNQGGPGPAALAGVLWHHSSQPRTDVESLLRALMFNYLVGGTDAHAKNYSILSGAGGKVRLAPLYDISSALPYPALQKRKIKMAMKIGSHYRWWDIQLRDWQATAEDMHLDADDALRTLARMCLQLPRQAERLLAQFRGDGIGHEVLDRLVGEIEASCRRCLQQFKAPSEA